MDAEKMMMQKRIDNLQQHIDYLYGVGSDYERQIVKLKVELEAMKRQRDALLKTIDVEYIARLEEKAMRCDALEEMIKRGLCKENGGIES